MTYKSTTYSKDFVGVPLVGGFTAKVFVDHIVYWVENDDGDLEISLTNGDTLISKVSSDNFTHFMENLSS